MIPRVTMRAALSDTALLGSVLAGDSWLAWRTLLIAAMGEALTDDERPIFKQFTNRETEPRQRVEEFVAVKGRRGGGSRAASVLATYIAGLCQHPALVRGERGVLLCIAADQRQADVILDYTEANFRDTPVLSQLVEARTARELRLTNKIDVEVRAADFRRLRGLSFVAVIADEIAFFPTSEDSTNLDSEILTACRPGLATTGGPMFLISSPYARKGELWNLFKQHYGPNGDPLILVAQGSSKSFNPTLPQSVVDRAYERDAVAAAAEYGGEFRIDIQQLFIREAVLACVAPCVYERSRQHYEWYHAFCDPSGGSSDSMTLAIGHLDITTGVMIVDAIREAKPPFSPEAVTAEFAGLCKAYGVSSVIGDRYAGEWPKEQFGKFGVSYEQSAKPKSDLYIDLLAAINSRRVALLDHGKLINQLCSLERRAARSGKDSIDHAPGAHDDLANSVAGLCAAAINKYGNYDVTLRAFADDYVDPDSKAAAAQPPPEPPRCNGDWWRSMPRSQASTGANERLRELYRGLDDAFKWGPPRRW
jgi:hypothetical protein